MSGSRSLIEVNAHSNGSDNDFQWACAILDIVDKSTVPPKLLTANVRQGNQFLDWDIPLLKKGDTVIDVQYRNIPRIGEQPSLRLWRDSINGQIEPKIFYSISVNPAEDKALLRAFILLREKLNF